MFQVFLDVFWTCYNLMFQVFKVFQMYVSIVSCGCCKSRSGCCNSCTHMLQAFYPQCFICFLYMYVAGVSDACLKCFIYLLLYVASVVFVCFKSRPGYCICVYDIGGRQGWGMAETSMEVNGAQRGTDRGGGWRRGGDRLPRVTGALHSIMRG